MVLGDFNAKVKKARNADELRILGGYCEPGKRTPNGVLLLQVMVEAGLVSLAGQSRPPSSVPTAAKAGYWWTRRDPKTKVKHTIDYVLVSKGLNGIVTRFWVDYTDLNSDHQLIGAEIDCPRKVVRKRDQKKSRRRLDNSKIITRGRRRCSTSSKRSLCTVFG